MSGLEPTVQLLLLEIYIVQMTAVSRETVTVELVIVTKDGHPMIALKKTLVMIFIVIMENVQWKMVLQNVNVGKIILVQDVYIKTLVSI